MKLQRYVIKHKHINPPKIFPGEEKKYAEEYTKWMYDTTPELERISDDTYAYIDDSIYDFDE